MERGTCLAHSTGERHDRTWAAISKVHRRANPWCWCGKPATVVDHVIPLTLHASVQHCLICRREHRELQCLCALHHRRKTDTEDVRTRPAW